MKKMALLLVLILVLSACSGNVSLDAEGDVVTDLLPGDTQDNGGQTEQQPPPSDSTFRNPIMIILIVLVAILIVLFVFTLGRRTR